MTVKKLNIKKKQLKKKPSRRQKKQSERISQIVKINIGDKSDKKNQQIPLSVSQPIIIPQQNPTMIPLYNTMNDDRLDKLLFKINHLEHFKQPEMNSNKILNNIEKNNNDIKNVLKSKPKILNEEPVDDNQVHIPIQLEELKTSSSLLDFINKTTNKPLKEDNLINSDYISNFDEQIQALQNPEKKVEEQYDREQVKGTLDDLISSVERDSGLTSNINNINDIIETINKGPEETNSIIDNIEKRKGRKPKENLTPEEEREQLRQKEKNEKLNIKKNEKYEIYKKLSLEQGITPKKISKFKSLTDLETTINELKNK